MAKSKESRPAKTASLPKAGQPSIKVDKKAFDPTLASLFAASSGPVQAPPKSRYQERIVRKPVEDPEDEVSEDEEEEESGQDDASQGASSDVSSESSEAEDEDMEEDTEDDDASDSSAPPEKNADAVLARIREAALNGTQDSSKKKRKRGDKEEIEETYMRKLAREEEKEEEQRQKKRKTAAQEDKSDSSSETSEEETEEFTVPQHESLTNTNDKDASELEKAARTVFLSNVSSDCINTKSAEKALKKHLESFIPDLADNKPAHKIESLRFRSTAFATALPKRAAFAKKEIMDSTTKSTNAYAVYTTKIAAREAVKRLNGSILLNRHLHVDSVAHPMKVEHRRCVFVGNLPFVDDESQTPNEDGTEKKKKTPADVEEGLWIQFGKVGKVESVRVVRDAKTRVGKGFAYVQFVDENGVEAALQLNEKKFPPMLPRLLRVTRCKAEKKNKDKPRGPPPSKAPKANGKTGYAPKLTEEQKSMQGRARSMLGKVAKAQTKESFTFEGHRASEKQGKSGLKFKGSGGKKKGPNGRKARSASWKKTGGKK